MMTPQLARGLWYANNLNCFNVGININTHLSILNPWMNCDVIISKITKSKNSHLLRLSNSFGSFFIVFFSLFTSLTRPGPAEMKFKVLPSQVMQAHQRRMQKSGQFDFKANWTRN